MNNYIRSIVFVILCIGLIGFISSSVMASSDMSGSDLFRQKCSICHGVNGAGDGPAAAGLDPKPTNFTSPDFWQPNVDETIRTTVENGKGAMPAFQFSKEELQEIVDYITKKFKK